MWSTYHVINSCCSILQKQNKKIHEQKTHDCLSVVQSYQQFLCAFSALAATVLILFLPQDRTLSGELTGTSGKQNFFVQCECISHVKKYNLSNSWRFCHLRDLSHFFSLCKYNDFEPCNPFQTHWEGAKKDTLEHSTGEH